MRVKIKPYPPLVRSIGIMIESSAMGKAIYVDFWFGYMGITFNG